MNYRSLMLQGTTALIIMLSLPNLVRAGAGGGGLSITFHVCKGGPNAALECANDADCPKSDCVETTFLSDLLRCEGGADDGEICTKNQDCDSQHCTLNFAKVPALSAKLTLIVDDHAYNFVDTDSCERAATILLEVKGRQAAQTYLCIRDDQFPELEFLRTEQGLIDSINDPSIPSLLNRLLFRRTGGF